MSGKIKAVLLSFIVLLILGAVSYHFGLLNFSKVHILTDQNFDPFNHKHSYVFVKFYAPWCGHCKQIAPQYQKFAQLAQGREYAVAELDSTKHTVTSQVFGIQGYPTLKFFIRGQPIDYEGQRTAEQLLKWADSKMAKKVIKINDTALQQIQGVEDFLLIQGHNATQLQIFRAAHILDNIPYYSKPGAKKRVILNLKNGKTKKYIGRVDIKRITGWTKVNVLDILIPIQNKQRFKMVFDTPSKHPVFLLLHHDDMPLQKVQVLRQFCDSRQQTLRCGFVNSSYSMYKPLARILNVMSYYQQNAVVDQTVIGYFKDKTTLGYKVNNPLEITNESLSQFIIDVNKGDIKLYRNQSGDIKQRQLMYEHAIYLNAQNFNQTLKKHQYVLVKFYSPTCPHCLNYVNDFDDLAKQGKLNYPEYVFAVANTLKYPQILRWQKITKYPTINFYVRGAALNFEGQRQKHQIIQYMVLSSLTELTVTQNIQQKQKPYVLVSGIDKKSHVHLLTLTFTKYPIYLAKSDQHYIKLVTQKQVATYSGLQDLQSIIEWLSQLTESPLVNLLPKQGQKQSSRFSKSITEHIPFLFILNRNGTGDYVQNYLQDYCRKKTKITCGYVTPDSPNFQNFNNWLGPELNSSHLLWMNTKYYTRHVYTNDMNALTNESLDNFVNQCFKKDEEFEVQVKKAEQQKKKKQQEQAQKNMAKPQEVTPPKTDESLQL